MLSAASILLLSACDSLDQALHPVPMPPQASGSLLEKDPNLEHWKIASGNQQTPPGKLSVDTLNDTASSPLNQPQVTQLGPSAPVQPAAAPQFVFGENRNISLNFVNADVHEVVATVLGDILKKNYFLDPKVQGTVTFHTLRPLAMSEVPGVLEDMLALTGAALVPAGDAYKIVPLDQAAKAPAILGGMNSPPGVDRAFGIHVIPVRYVSAEALKTAAEPLLPPGRAIYADTEHHLVMFVGTGSEAQDIADFIATLDVDPMAGKSIGLYPVKFSDPDSVAKELKAILTPASAAGASDLVQILPLNRMSAVLVISADPAYQQRAKALVDTLDHGSDAVQRRLFVRYVQNGRAGELASTLRQVLGIASTTAASQTSPVGPGLQPTTMTSGPSPNSQLAAGAPPPPPLPGGGVASELAATQSQGSGLPSPYDNSQNPNGELTNVGAPSDATGGGQQNQLRIVADDRNNALVIYATPREYELIDAALQKLDIVPLQVLIEATIAEVTLGDNLQYGLQWFFNSGSNNFAFSAVDTGAIAPAFPGFSYLLNVSNARVVLNALTAITQVKVISSPELMVLDNESARLQVGDQVPVISRTSTSVVNPDAPQVNEVTYLDTGVILNITPRVSASGLVILDISQEVSDVTKTSTSNIDSPTIQQRRIASSVAVNSGETIALGGLIKDRNEKDNTGIPLLSNIPVIGNLFKTTGNTTDRTELLVLLSPRVVKDNSDARLATDELRQQMKGLAILEQHTPPYASNTP